MHSKVPASFILRLCRTPYIMTKVIKSLIRKHVTVNLDYHLGKNGFSFPLSQISLKITNKCNLRCKMCAQWGEKGYNLGKPASVIKEVVPLETYKKMVDDVAHLKPIIYIWGGEPFLYDDLMPLVAYMKDKKFVTSVVTNGVKLEQHAEEIVDRGWEVLMLSLDGPGEVHDEIRGVKGCFNTLAKGIDAVQTLKRKKNKTLPYVMIFVTITKDNAPLLDKIMDIGDEIGIDSMILYYSWFTTEEIGKKHVEVMQKKLDCTPEAWKGYLFDYKQIDIEALQDTVRRIKDKKLTYPYMFIPDISIEDIPKYYTDPSYMFGYDNCVAPWLIAEVMPNGDVAPCRDYPDYVVGNICEDSIVNIFNNERYRKFRTALKEEGGLFPICARCCGLMGF